MFKALSASSTSAMDGGGVPSSMDSTGGAGGAGSLDDISSTTTERKECWGCVWRAGL
jgi:hypothetical protein